MVGGLQQFICCFKISWLDTLGGFMVVFCVLPLDFITVCYLGLCLVYYRFIH